MEAWAVSSLGFLSSIRYRPSSPPQTPIPPTHPPPTHSSSQLWLEGFICILLPRPVMSCQALSWGNC